MPSRRSDRGGALARALRRDDGGDNLKAMLEFTEPYGTMAAMGRVAGGEAGPFDYAAAIPLVGGVARAGRQVKRAVDSFGDPVAAHRRTAGQAGVGNALYDELEFPMDDLGADEFMEAVAEQGDRVSPEARRLLRALDKDDWLGFDSPSQALQAVMREDIDQLDPSPAVRAALGRYHNAKGGY